MQRFFAKRGLQIATAGDMTGYGLPKPDTAARGPPDRLLGALACLGHGDITVKPNIERFAGGRTRPLRRRRREEIDLVVYCTGYKIAFPFFDREVFTAPGHRLPLYRRVVSVERPGLYFIGFIQPWARSCPSPRPSANGSPTCSPGGDATAARR